MFDELLLQTKKKKIQIKNQMPLSLLYHLKEKYQCGEYIILQMSG